MLNSLGPILVSGIILALFGAMILGYAPDTSDTSAKLMETCVTLVIGYWLGSSAGSRRKDQLLADKAS